jgi:transcriptional regulator with XRE-family HTH domain
MVAPSLVVADKLSGWGYRLAAQRRQGMRSYSTTSPSRSCSDSTTQPRERGLSQAKLAVMADMDPATLNRLERGTGNPNLKTLERVADALGVEVADFFPKAQHRSSLEPSLLDGLEEERHYKLEEARRAVQYIIGRAEWYEQELERERLLEYKTAEAAKAYMLAVLAIEEFSSFNRWFFDVVARDLVREIENGNASELVDEFDSLEETFIEHIGRTQRMLLNNANRLAETQDQRDALASRRKTGDSNIKFRQHSA